MHRETSFTIQRRIARIPIERAKPYSGQPVSGRDWNREISDPYEPHPLKNFGRKDPVTVTHNPHRGVEVIRRGRYEAMPDSMIVKSRVPLVSRLFSRLPPAGK